MTNRPSYFRVFLTFARNSLVRDMTFRWNFIIETLSSVSWVFMNLGFYVLVFRHTTRLGNVTDWGNTEFSWGKYEFFLFLATTLLINSLVQAFFMRNAQEFSELIRTGSLSNSTPSGSMTASRCLALRMRYSAWVEIRSLRVTTVRMKARSMLDRFNSSSL